MDFDYLQRRRLHILSWQRIPVLCNPYSKEVYSHVQMEQSPMNILSSGCGSGSPWSHTEVLHHQRFIFNSHAYMQCPMSGELQKVSHLVLQLFAASQTEVHWTLHCTQTDFSPLATTVLTPRFFPYMLYKELSQED